MMTEVHAAEDAELVERLARLSARRASRSGVIEDSDPDGAKGVTAPAEPIPARARARRRHPARTARIAATGLSATAMLGLVAALGATDAASADLAAVAVPTSTTVIAPDRSVPVFETPTPVTELSNEPIVLTAEPIVLTAEPIVRPAAPSPTAPTASTNGSR